MPASTLTPFTVAVDAAALSDLQERLARARLPAAPADAGWRFGVEPRYFARLIDYWRDGYDWRRAEAELNRHPQFTASVKGDDGTALRLHFLHRHGSGEAPLPILMLHGWPGSYYEFLGVVEPLARPEDFDGRPEDAFDVVVPSLPGYGFSEIPASPIGLRAIGGLLHRLMTEVLGYDRYLVQGGDWGALIAAWMALDHAPTVAAAHLNMVALRPPLGPGHPPVSDDEQAWIDAARARLKQESAYQDVHATKSQTLAYGLTDSPVGLAAWIVEKFHGWTDAALAEPPFAMDTLLTNVMLYWLTGTINSSTWLYRMARREGELRAPAERRIEVPCAYLLAPNDLALPPPTSWLARIGRVDRRNDLASGGHFVALENGPALVADVRAFAREHLR